MPPPTLILTQSDVRAVLTLRDCIAAVDAAPPARRQDPRSRRSRAVPAGS